jgi:hypothetical protein
MMSKKYVIVIALVGIFSISAMVMPTTTTNTYASHSVSPNACYNDGEEAGENGEFSPELYEFCEGYGDEYYEGFIDGCMSVEGNTRQVCESATDAG